MNKIKKDFEEFKIKQPNWGDYVILLSVVKGKKYSKAILTKSFDSLVSKEQYDKSEKIDYIDYLVAKSNETI